MQASSDSETKFLNVKTSVLNLYNFFSYKHDAPHQAEIIGDMYYRYDPNGNVTEERQGSHSDDAVSKTFMYSTPVTGVTSANQAWGWSRIDDTGETDSTYMRLYSWDEENRLTGTSDRNYTTSYSYDHEGERTVKYSNLGETLYFDSMWLEADTDGTSKLRQTKNIYIGETRIASKLNYEDGDINYEETHTFYYHTDHLSSSNVITDYQGDVYEHMEYTPYGEKWILDQNDSSKYDMIPYRFTGKEWDEETGLYYMSARYQNPETSRWVSSDPAGWELINPMENSTSLLSGINWYSYCENNPLKYSDPSGLDPNYANAGVDSDYYYSGEKSFEQKLDELGAYRDPRKQEATLTDPNGAPKENTYLYEDYQAIQGVGESLSQLDSEDDGYGKPGVITGPNIMKLSPIQIKGKPFWQHMIIQKLKV